MRGGEVWADRQGAVAAGDGLVQPTKVEQGDGTAVVRLRIVWIERYGPIGGGERLVQAAQVVERQRAVVVRGR